MRKYINNNNVANSTVLKIVMLIIQNNDETNSVSNNNNDNSKNDNDNKNQFICWKKCFLRLCLKLFKLLSFFNVLGICFKNELPMKGFLIGFCILNRPFKI